MIYIVLYHINVYVIVDETRATSRNSDETSRKHHKLSHKWYTQVTKPGHFFNRWATTTNTYTNIQMRRVQRLVVLEA